VSRWYGGIHLGPDRFKRASYWCCFESFFLPAALFSAHRLSPGSFGVRVVKPWIDLSSMNGFQYITVSKMIPGACRVEFAWRSIENARVVQWFLLRDSKAETDQLTSCCEIICHCDTNAHSPPQATRVDESQSYNTQSCPPSSALLRLGVYFLRFELFASSITVSCGKWRGNRIVYNSVCFQCSVLCPPPTHRPSTFMGEWVLDFGKCKPPAQTKWCGLAPPPPPPPHSFCRWKFKMGEGAKTKNLP